MVIVTKTLKDGREVWQCCSCDRWFTVKKNNRVDALGIVDDDFSLQCIGCSGGYQAVQSYLRSA